VAHYHDFHQLCPDRHHRSFVGAVGYAESAPEHDTHWFHGGNQRSDSEKTLFDHVKENNLDRLRELLAPGDLVKLDEHGMALIHWATDRNAVEIIQFLVRSGASVDQRDADQQTPLHYAASCGHLEALRCLLELRANLELCDSDGQTCYDVADDEQICQVLQKERERLSGSAC